MRTLVLLSVLSLSWGVAQQAAQQPAAPPATVRATPVAPGTMPEGWLNVTGTLRPTDRVYRAEGMVVTVQFHDISGQQVREVLTVEFDTRFLPAPYRLWVNPVRLGAGRHTVTVYVRNRAGEQLYRGSQMIERRDLGRVLDIEITPVVGQ